MSSLGRAAVEAARALTGRKLATLRPLRWAEAAPPGMSALGLAVCHELDPAAPLAAECANFVASVLRATGALARGRPLTSVPELRASLEASGHFVERAPNWAQVPPGAVVTLQAQGIDGQPEPSGHVVLFTGVVDGQPRFIGANPIDGNGALLEASGAQEVSELPLRAFQAWLGAAFAVTAVDAPT